MKSTNKRKEGRRICSLDLDAEKGGFLTAREKLGNCPVKMWDLSYLHDSLSSQNCYAVVSPGITISFPGFVPLLLMHLDKTC